jgi:hypothetical protein
VRLPVLSARDVDDAGWAISDTPTAAEGLARIDGVRVLLVEDDDDGRDVLAIILELAGATVTSGRSVREALTALDANAPDVIVSDVGMPDEDGYTLIHRVRAREGAEGRRHVPAIALTGYVLAADGARLLAAGFQMHVQKPVDPDAIVTAVASLVAK